MKMSLCGFVRRDGDEVGFAEDGVAGDGSL